MNVRWDAVVDPSLVASKTVSAPTRPLAPGRGRTILAHVELFGALITAGAKRSFDLDLPGGASVGAVLELLARDLGAEFLRPRARSRGKQALLLPAVRRRRRGRGPEAPLDDRGRSDADRNHSADGISKVADGINRRPSMNIMNGHRRSRSTAQGRRLDPVELRALLRLLLDPRPSRRRRGGEDRGQSRQRRRQGPPVRQGRQRADVPLRSQPADQAAAPHQSQEGPGRGSGLEGDQLGRGARRDRRPCCARSAPKIRASWWSSAPPR